MTDLRELLAANMKFHRKNTGISQAKLAEKVNTATNYIAMIETGRKFPSTQMLEKIAFALNIDTPELFSAKALHMETAEQLQKDILLDLQKIITKKINHL